MSGPRRRSGKSLKGLPQRLAVLARPLLVRRAVPSPVLAQRASDLLRELNLLLCGADEEELQHIVAAMAASQALATARLREERRHSAARARGAALE